MPKFRKKPVVIDAALYEPGMEDGFLRYTLPDGPASRPIIKTLEGNMEITPGDWIITGIAGEKYPCKDKIFRESYDSVDVDGCESDDN